MSENTREQKFRRALRKNGYALHKSRAKNMSLDNMLGYMITDYFANFVVAGSRYDLSLDDVGEWICDTL